MREHARQNGVPADYYDPEARIPRLPMPYRMVDRVLRDLVEEALEVARDDPPTEEPPAPIAPSFGLAVPATLGHVVALQPATAQPIIFVGTSAGKLLCINSLRGEVVGEPIDLDIFARIRSSNYQHFADQNTSSRYLANFLIQYG